MRYHDYRGAMRELLASILTGVSRADLLRDSDARRAAMCAIAAHCPFVDLIDALN